MPKRIQFKRQKGFHLPENCVRVTRPGKFGNPFKVGIWFNKMSSDWFVFSCGDTAFGNRQVKTTEESLELFESYTAARIKWDKQWLEPLRGKDVACFCPENQNCHGDILLKYANRD